MNMAPCYRPKTARQDEKFSLHRHSALHSTATPHRQTTYVKNEPKKLLESTIFYDNRRSSVSALAESARLKTISHATTVASTSPASRSQPGWKTLTRRS